MKQRLIRVMGGLIVISVLTTAAIFLGYALPALAINNLAVSSQEANSTSTLPPTMLSQKEDLVRELEERVQKWQDTVDKPGWLHIVSNVRDNAASNIRLSNGAQIPTEYIIEDWYLLDSSGQVLQAVTYMRDVDNNVIQVSVLKNGNWHNLTLGETSPASGSKPRIDFGFLQMATAPGITVEKLNYSLESKESILYVIAEDYPGPEKNITKTQMKAYFDPEGGLMLLETVFISIDGSEILDSTTKIQKVENVHEPTEEVIKVMEEVNK